MSAEFGGRGGISKVLLKGVCEHTETREPAQAGDVEAKARYSSNIRKMHR